MAGERKGVRAGCEAFRPCPGLVQASSGCARRRAIRKVGSDRSTGACNPPRSRPQCAQARVLRLLLFLLFFVPVCALLGAFTAVDNGERTVYVGATAGALIGAFFGLGFAGALPRKWVDVRLEPEDDRE
jgi:hypothetical protein